MGVSDDDVSAARAGDARAAEQIYQYLAPRVRRYLWARGAEDPEGMTHDAFVTVFQSLDRLEGGALGLARFTFSVAHARYVDEVRRRSRRPVLVSYSGADDGRVATSAEAIVLDSLVHSRAYQLLAGLRDDQRDVVAMRVLGELSLEETAAVMGRSVGAIKQLQRRGLQALRLMLDEDGEADG